jgi:hypothetical protein
MKTKTPFITIGLDLGDKKHALCVLNQDGDIIDERTIRCSPPHGSYSFGARRPAMGNSCPSRSTVFQPPREPAASFAEVSRRAQRLRSRVAQPWIKRFLTELVVGNSERNGRFAWFAKRLVYKWLNRRSQRRSMTWRKYCERWKMWGIPAARVMES